MTMRFATCLALLLVVNAQHDASSLLQTWDKGSNTNTPVTRVVNLLKEMQDTLHKEQEEDEELFDKLDCWCNNNQYEKNEAVSASEAKIAELEALIESLTARSAQLKTEIKETEAQVAADKKALAEATAMREKQLAEFHEGEKDSIQAIENLKGAIIVLSKHHKKDTVAKNEVGKELESWSLISTGHKEEPWTANRAEHNLEEFMQQNNYNENSALEKSPKFLEPSTSMSSNDQAIIDRALKSAAVFMQAQHQYFPSYSSQSGEIFGILKQMKEEMAGDLGEAQAEENKRAALFAELRASKTAQIEAGEKLAEEKEDQLATAEMDLAEAKEDLGQENQALGESQTFLKNLKKTCAEADKNFAARKEARMNEITAVSETIEILTADDARDAMSGTYNFLQITQHRASANRNLASKVLRMAAAKSHSPLLSALATSVEMDAFSKVKKAIDDMVAALTKEQADEVKKNDFCNNELHATEMATAKTTDLKEDLVAKSEDLAATIKRLSDEIAAHQKSIEETHINLQRATEDRIVENHDYQRTVNDQTVTVAVLEKALDRLATFYDLLQRSGHAHAVKQTPPVPQMEYKPSKGAGGVMQMIEKLIFEAKDMISASKKAENESQKAYEALVADSNKTVQELQKQVVSKTKAKAAAKKELADTEQDIMEAVDELERLSKYAGDLHADCDYVIKNFDIRQQARAEEITALGQAKQILSGANMA